jgi:hypothetical protein
MLMQKGENMKNIAFVFGYFIDEYSPAIIYINARGSQKVGRDDSQIPPRQDPNPAEPCEAE